MICLRLSGKNVYKFINFLTAECGYKNWYFQDHTPQKTILEDSRIFLMLQCTEISIIPWALIIPWASSTQWANSIYYL